MFFVGPMGTGFPESSRVSNKFYTICECNWLYVRFLYTARTAERRKEREWQRGESIFGHEMLPVTMSICFLLFLMICPNQQVNQSLIPSFAMQHVSFACILLL